MVRFGRTRSLASVISIICVLFGECLTAQTFKGLHNFVGSDGTYPVAEVTISGNTLYGTSSGKPDNLVASTGTVFKVEIDGTRFAVLHKFIRQNMGTNSDGVLPNPLILIGNTLYGTAAEGGISGYGTAFAINVDGSGFRILHTFNWNEGAGPVGALIASGSVLYGATFQGGSGKGTLYSLDTNGSQFVTLYKFTVGDGDSPEAGLILSSNTLFGTTLYGGTSGEGTIFKFNISESTFTTIHSFSARNNYTNSDGAQPWAGLLFSDGMLYGTASSGGILGFGTVYELKDDGSDFTTLHSFSIPEGFNVLNGLAKSGDTLYGTAWDGGFWGNGTIYRLNIDGSGFAVVHSFNWYPNQPPPPDSYSFTNTDGIRPYGLISSGNCLYGATEYGGSSGRGTLFSLSFSPELTMALLESGLVLMWPTNYAGFDYTGYVLESSSNLGPSAIWTTNLPTPVVVNGQNTVTNPILSAPQFFRLAQ